MLAENLVKAYAEENGIEAMEIILFAWPIVNYHQEPLVLTPEVRNFFYGMDGDYEKEEWCSWEENEDAPNFGYDDQKLLDTPVFFPSLLILRIPVDNTDLRITQKAVYF